MLISILIPTISERGEQFQKLQDGLYTQIKANKLEKKVEIISISDNRTIPLSQKRNMLQKLARGKYFTHLDDDDNLADDYCSVIINHIESLKELPDIISYNQLAKVNGQRFIVNSDIEAPLYLIPIGGTTNYAEFKRYPWQWCLWSEKFKKVYRSDSDTNAREDQNWLKKIQLEYPKTISNLDFMGHVYNFDDPSLSSCQ